MCAFTRTILNLIINSSHTVAEINDKICIRMYCKFGRRSKQLRYEELGFD